MMQRWQPHNVRASTVFTLSTWSFDLWEGDICSLRTSVGDFSALPHKLCWPIHQDRSAHAGIDGCRSQSPGSAHVHEALGKNCHWAHHTDFAYLSKKLFFFALPSLMGFSIQSNTGQMLRCSFQEPPPWLSPWNCARWTGSKLGC